MFSKQLFHIRIVFPFVTHLLILTIVLTRKGYKIHSSLTAPGCAYILDYFPRIHSHDLGILFMLKEVDYGSDYCPRQRVLLRKRKYTKVYVKGNRIRFGLLSSSMSCNRTELLKVYVKGDRIRFKLLFCPHRRVFFM